MNNDEKLEMTVQSERQLTEQEQKEVLKTQSTELLSKIVSETNSDNLKALTELFNENLLKKSISRLDKYSDLLDLVSTQAFKRMAEHPEEVETKQLFEAMKIIQDLMEKNANQIKNNSQVVTEQNTVIINQNNVKVGDSAVSHLNIDSRKRINDLISSIVNSNQQTGDTSEIIEADVIDGETIDEEK